VDGVEPPGRRCAPRVLQGARRGDGRAPHARRLRSHRAAGGAVCGHGLCGAQLRRSDIGWPSEVSQITPPRPWPSTKSITSAATLWSPSWATWTPKPRCRCWRNISAAFPGPKPEEMTTVEPPQFAEKSVIIREQTQPFYIEGYHRPSYRDPDDAVYDAISDIMSNGRVSRLYRSLVEQQQIAAEAEGSAPSPAKSIPASSRSMPCRCPATRRPRCATPSTRRLTSSRPADVTDAELQMYKTRTRADLLRGLADNQGLASSLAEYQTRYGDWRELFLQLDEVDKVTKADIRRVANQGVCGFQPDQRRNRHRAPGRGRKEGWRRAMKNRFQVSSGEVFRWALLSQPCASKQKHLRWDSACGQSSQQTLHNRSPPRSFAVAPAFVGRSNPSPGSRFPFPRCTNFIRSSPNASSSRTAS
jgi:hypothetical protein